jgi:hypothetical protein
MMGDWRCRECQLSRLELRRVVPPLLAQYHKMLWAPAEHSSQTFVLELYVPPRLCSYPLHLAMSLPLAAWVLGWGRGRPFQELIGTCIFPGWCVR